MASRKDRSGWFLYFLRCPETLEVRYVGISTNPRSRFKNHLSFSFHVPNKPWIDGLKSRGLLPVQDVVLGPVTKSQADRAEVRLMRLHTKYRPGSLLQRVPTVGGKALLRVFGEKDIDANTPFAATNASLGLYEVS